MASKKRTTKICLSSRVAIAAASKKLNEVFDNAECKLRSKRASGGRSLLDMGLAVY